MIIMYDLALICTDVPPAASAVSSSGRGRSIEETGSFADGEKTLFFLVGSM